MTEHKKTKIFKKKGGCNEDCFNCKYKDCYKPTHLMKKENKFINCERSKLW